MNKLTRLLALLCVAAAGAIPAQAQELKIGFLAPRTGIITQLGTDMINGFQMYLDEHDGKLGGANVKFIVEDDKGAVDGDVAMAKKLILQDKVDMLVGAVLGSASYALAPVSNEGKTLFIGTITTGDDLANGTGVFQTRFFVALNSAGRAKPSATPAPFGPRNCSHSSVRPAPEGLLLCCAYVWKSTNTNSATTTVGSRSLTFTICSFRAS